MWLLSKSPFTVIITEKLRNYCLGNQLKSNVASKGLGSYSPFKSQSPQDDIGVVKYAVPIPATPPTVPAKVRNVLLDMLSGLISGNFGAWEISRR